MPRKTTGWSGYGIHLLFLMGIMGGGGAGGIQFLEQVSNDSVSIAVLVSTFNTYGLVSNYWGKP